MKSPQDKATAHGLRVVAWELTRRCVLECRHCRGAARDTDYSGELSTDECRAVVDGLASFSAPLLILTGGEPMMRPDVYEIAVYAVGRGLRVVVAPCGHLVTPETAKKLKASGISGVSISLDGAQAGTHDAFRGVQGAFDAACRAIRCAIEAGIGVQVNTTVTRHNAAELPAVLDLAVRLGARTLDLFFLVPTGRGALLKDLSLDAAEYEKVLAWVADTVPRAPLRLKTTCAPQYARIVKQRGGDNPRAPSSKGDRNAAHTAGCMAGRGFLFIAHTGILHPCGFLPVPCGDLRSLRFDVRTAVESSAPLAALRAVDSFHGSCGVCEYRIECGGCRARAFALSGDMLGAEPFCRHVPSQSPAHTGRS